MPIYDYECKHCGIKVVVSCKMSAKEENTPSCDEHGPMDSLITNTNKHVDNTGTRKGYFNSKEGYHR